MNPVPRTFDRKQVQRNRERAAALEPGPHDFLFTWVMDNIAERLGDIRRTFETALIIGPRGGKINVEKLSRALGSPAPYTMDLVIPPGAGSRFVQGDEEYLPFAAHSLDAVICPLNLHTINDLPGTLIQINHTLKPDGLFLGAMLGGETLYELRDCLMRAEMALKGGISPRVAPFADKQQAGALMQRAGFALPVVDSDIITVTYKTPFDLMHDLRLMGESNSVAARSKAPPGKAFMQEAAQLYSETYPAEDGRITATFEIISLIGWAPHENQPRPLRPGSAKHSLAEALDTKEIGTGEKTAP